MYLGDSHTLANRPRRRGVVTGEHHDVTDTGAAQAGEQCRDGRAHFISVFDNAGETIVDDDVCAQCGSRCLKLCERRGGGAAVCDDKCTRADTDDPAGDLSRHALSGHFHGSDRVRQAAKAALPFGNDNAGQ